MIDPCRFVVWPHHPDVLRRPAVIGVDARAAQALTWNVFRALELLPPAFWLRRLNASLGIRPLSPAPVTASVRLWPQLPTPPGRGLSTRDAVDADIVIETEHAVWALLVCNGDVDSSHLAAGIDRVALLAYAASWYAGRRHCYVGIIVGSGAETPLGLALVRKYQALPHALHLRWPDRHHDGSNLRGLGVVAWSCLIAILDDATKGDSLGVVEGTIARYAVGACSA